MQYVFDEDEKRVEYWLKPFTARAMLPGYRLQLVENTRSFWHYYWELLLGGYTEGMLADYALHWKVYHQLPAEIALTLSVTDLGRYRGITLPVKFDVPTQSHPHRGYANAVIEDLIAARRS